LVELNPMVSNSSGNFLAKDIKIEPDDDISIEDEDFDMNYNQDSDASDQYGKLPKPVIRKRPNMFPFEVKGLIRHPVQEKPLLRISLA